MKKLTPKKAIIIILVTSFILSMITSCASTKEGCWKGSEPRYRYNTTKMRA